MQQVFPTKGNLIQLKKQLDLAKLGYELLDKKRNIMLREMLSLAKIADDNQNDLNVRFNTAYKKLQNANMTVGQTNIIEAANTISVSDDLTIRMRSIMGVEISEVIIKEFQPKVSYGFLDTDYYVDEAYIEFNMVKQLAARQAALENNIYKLAYAIKQAQKRANALKNIVIPNLISQIAYITNYLEEKERDEFAILKILKSKNKGTSQ
jgi:H(+)-transporting ATP synthase, vacuolar type, subunit D